MSSGPENRCCFLLSVISFIFFLFFESQMVFYFFSLSLWERVAVRPGEGFVIQGKGEDVLHWAHPRKPYAGMPLRPAMN
jgi:hypothetical protein